MDIDDEMMFHQMTEEMSALEMDDQENEEVICRPSFQMTIMFGTRLMARDNLNQWCPACRKISRNFSQCIKKFMMELRINNYRMI